MADEYKAANAASSGAHAKPRPTAETDEIAAWRQASRHLEIAHYMISVASNNIEAQRPQLFAASQAARLALSALESERPTIRPEKRLGSFAVNPYSRLQTAVTQLESGRQTAGVIKAIEHCKQAMKHLDDDV